MRSEFPHVVVRIFFTRTFQHEQAFFFSPVQYSKGCFGGRISVANTVAGCTILVFIATDGYRHQRECLARTDRRMISPEEEEQKTHETGCPLNAPGSFPFAWSRCGQSELVAVYKVDVAYGEVMAKADGQLKAWRNSVGSGRVVTDFGKKVLIFACTISSFLLAHV